MGRQIGGNCEFQTLVQQKRDNDYQIILWNSQIEPLSCKISNVVARIMVIDQQTAHLATEADQLSLEKAALRAEYDSTLSLPSLISMGGRSIFDGATLGQFADKGPMTESIKFQNWMIDASKRDAVRRERANQIIRKWTTLEQGRAEEVAKLKPLIKQENELQNSYNPNLDINSSLKKSLAD